jgi:hypothetical protein
LSRDSESSDKKGNFLLHGAESGYSEESNAMKLPASCRWQCALWCLCALLIMCVTPSHCAFCDGPDLTITHAGVSHGMNAPHSVPADDCNGFCSCCVLQCIPVVHAAIEQAAMLPHRVDPVAATRLSGWAWRLQRPPRG